MRSRLLVLLLTALAVLWPARVYAYPPVPGLDWRVALVDPLTGNPVTPAAGGTISTVNSTTATLGNGATFTGTGEDVSAFALITVAMTTDQISGGNGLQMQFSPDNTNWDVTYQWPGIAIGANGVNIGQVYSTPPIERYFRVVYVNGVTPQTVFRLQTSYHAAGIPMPYQIYNANVGSFEYIRSANNLITNFGGGTQPAFIGASMRANNTFDLLTQANASAGTTGNGLLGVGAQGFDGTNYRNLLLNTDGSLDVGGFTVTPSFTFTRPANTTQYTANTALANATSGAAQMTWTSAARRSGGSGMIHSVWLLDQAAQATKAQLELWIFDTTLSTVVNDDAAWTPANADLAHLVGVVTLGSTPFLSTNSVVYNVTGLNMPFVCSGSANLVGQLVVRNTYTPVSAESFTARLQISDD